MQMVDHEPRRGLKIRAEQITVKASGLSYLVVTGIGVNRLASGGSIGRSLAEVGLGIVAGTQLTARERLKAFSSEKVRDAIGTAAVPTMLAVGVLGGSNFNTPSGKYEVATAAFITTSAVIFRGKEVSRWQTPPSATSESKSQ
jgi:hypothetical protein